MATSPDRWERIEGLYHAALECDPAVRGKFLDTACGQDEDLRHEVDSLLVEASPGNELLDRRVGEFLASRSAMELHTTELESGTLLGPYRIERLIGQGGMGKVYKTRDTRLGRSVAIKISSANFSEGFEREARAAAALNHPHICQLYDVGPDYLVMEYIEGSPLKGPLPVDQALKYAEQICDALEAAHRSGIIHRDLKPGNILLSRQGIKLLDFGLARMEPRPGETAAMPSGPMMGTPAYMAPEQWDGKRADVRSDIYSFGCILYEMLTGKSPARDRIPVAPPLEGILRTCLETDPDDRWQSARELKHALRWVAEVWSKGPAVRKNLWPRMMSISLSTAIIAAAAVAFHYGQHAVKQPPLRLQLDPPPGTRFLVEENLGGIALSPDGKIAAFLTTASGRNDLWVQALDGSQARRLAGGDDAIYPFWSPDGKSLGFFSGGKLRRIDADGGMAVTLCDVGTNSGGGTWTSDGRILFGTNVAGLFQVSAAGGVVTPLTVPDVQRGEASHVWPQVLPGGSLLFFIESDKAGTAGVYATSLSRPSERVQLLSSNTNAIYAEAGNRSWLLWLRGATLVAQEFDTRSLKLSGDPRTLADPVSSTGPPDDRLNVAIPGGGLLFYRASSTSNQFTWLDRMGKPVGNAGDPGNYADFRFSPDGRRIAAATGAGDIWLIDAQRRVASPFTFGGRNNIYPVWSPDGQTIVFHRGDHDLMRKPSSAVNSEELLLHSLNIPDATDWSRDGHSILYFEIAADATGRASRDLWVLPVSSDGRIAPGEKPIPYTRTPFNEKNGRFSPELNPRWVAFQSDESGRYEIYIDSFPAPRGKVRISTNGGQYPEWGPGGRELFYSSPDGVVMSVDLKIVPEKGANTSILPGYPRELFKLPPANFDPGASPFEAATDGQKFLVRASAEKTSEALSLIVNWPALLDAAHKK